jgi:hypothetical protein
VYAQELACADCLINMIYDAIDTCSQVKWRWFLASDAVTMEENTQIIPMSDPLVEPETNTSREDQLDAFKKFIGFISVHGQALGEDVEEIFISLEDRTDSNFVITNNTELQTRLILKK